MKPYHLILLLFLLSVFGVNAQKTGSTQTIDKVVAVVGNEPILLSEIEIQMHQIQGGVQDPKKVRCYLLDQMIQHKILLSKAKTDSLKVTNEQVESELNRRIEYFSSQ